MKQILIGLINFYQIFLSFDRGLLSVFAPGGACRYPVSCSQYMKQSIIERGALKGTQMGLSRLWSCK